MKMGKKKEYQRSAGINLKQNENFKNCIFASKNFDMSKKGKVLMAMSGGIDSTVAALMLHKEGYDVI